MPVRSSSRQPDGRRPWFAEPAGQAVLASEMQALQQARAERPGLPVLWLSALAAKAKDTPAGCLRLSPAGEDFTGDLRCGPGLALASESVGTVVLQHVAEVHEGWPAWLEECTRVLVPGGRLWIFALNPLSPYRLRWTGNSLDVCEPVTWRRRMRAHGLRPEPVSVGLGPRWRVHPLPDEQTGAGSRAAYLLRAEKLVIPLTRIRQPALRWQPGLPAS